LPIKLIYILGLEHSGTTLTDYLLSAHESVIGLGEIGSFFSPAHMKQYDDRWGGNDDAYICSCGEPLDKCSFWSDLEHLSGLKSDSPLPYKYQCLLQNIKTLFGDECVIVDSSKSIECLKVLISNLAELGLSKEDVLVVYALKDVRSFAASMIKKSRQAGGFVSVLRTFNYWLGANREILAFLRSSGINYVVSFYEALCRDPDGLIQGYLEQLNYLSNALLASQNSHIAMGNKDFVIRNKSRVRYDWSWFNNDKINLVYLLHRPARLFNKKIYDVSSKFGERL